MPQLTQRSGLPPALPVPQLLLPAPELWVPVVRALPAEGQELVPRALPVALLEALLALPSARNYMRAQIYLLLLDLAILNVSPCASTF
ncbi:MAG: hypothetical protein OXD31_16905 [Chloroflexi bacterium]|nr:hypothetical protein [Chloroflexota bacterium]